MLVACGVSHHHHAQRFLRVEAHNVPEAGTAAEVLDKSGSLLIGLSGAEPAQTEITLAPLGVIRCISATEAAESSRISPTRPPFRWRRTSRAASATPPIRPP